MSWEGWVTLTLVLCIVGGLARSVASTDALLLGGLVVLAVLHPLSDRFPDPKELASGFGNEALVLVAVMYVMVAGVVYSGGTQQLSTRLLGAPRSRLAGQLRLLLPVAALSGFVNNTPVVAVFLPVVKSWTQRLGIAGSALYLPLSYAAVLGGTTTLVGTSTTLVVQSALIAAGEPPLGMFTITRLGLPIALCGLTYLIWVAPRLLPDRPPTDQKLQDPRNYTAELEISTGGPLVGKTLEAAGLRNLAHLYVAQILRGGQELGTADPTHVLQGGDRLVLVGALPAVVDLVSRPGLQAVREPQFQLTRRRPSARFVEAVVSNTSPVIGRGVRASDFRTRYGAAILAMHRDGHILQTRIGDLVLQPGDTLLLHTDTRFVEEQRTRRDFLLVANLDGVEPPVHARAPRALCIFGLCVLGFVADSWVHIGVLPIALLAAALMMLTGCCTMEQARRSIDWPVLLSIGASLGLAKAMQSTGAAAAIAHSALQAVQSAGLGVHGTVFAIYLLTLLLTELVTNNAAAAIAFPIAHATAQQLNIDTLPLAICVSLAASCGFATPLGYQTHMMVYGAGGYRFSDFVRVGLGLDLLCMALTVGLLPWLFGL